MKSCKLAKLMAKEVEEWFIGARVLVINECRVSVWEDGHVLGVDADDGSV
jgi:hypothetical protein